MRISRWNFVVCPKPLGTRTKFQLEILTINVITDIVYFREIILESSRNISETTPWCQVENEDVIGAAPTGDAPTTSEWSMI